LLRGEGGGDFELQSLPEVLVVDDEPMNIEVMRAMLDQKGIEIDCALNGKIALKLIQQRFEQVRAKQGRMYRLILLDFSMPEMDGPELARELKKLFF